MTERGRSGEVLFLDLALEDLTEAADLFRPIHDAAAGIEGWALLEVSPLLADDAATTMREAPVGRAAGDAIPHSREPSAQFVLLEAL